MEELYVAIIINNQGLKNDLFFILVCLLQKTESQKHILV